MCIRDSGNSTDYKSCGRALSEKSKNETSDKRQQNFSSHVSQYIHIQYYIHWAYFYMKLFLVNFVVRS